MGALVKLTLQDDASPFEVDDDGSVRESRPCGYCVWIRYPEGAQRKSP